MDLRACKQLFWCRSFCLIASKVIQSDSSWTTMSGCYRWIFGVWFERTIVSLSFFNRYIEYVQILDQAWSSNKHDFKDKKLFDILGCWLRWTWMFYASVAATCCPSRQNAASLTPTQSVDSPFMMHNFRARYMNIRRKQDKGQILNSELCLTDFRNLANRLSRVSWLAGSGKGSRKREVASRHLRRGS